MVSSQSAAGLVFVLLVISCVSTDTRSLQAVDLQNEENILGIRTWCRMCRSLADFNAAELLLLSSQTLTLGEALMLSCQTLSGNTQERCERIISSISEGLGYSLATTGNIFPMACNAAAFCNSVNVVDAPLSKNTIFDFLCNRCKRLAAFIFGSTDVIVSEENLRAIFTPFCTAIGVLIGADACLDTLSKRFQETYASGKAVLNPDTICQLYGSCALATTAIPSPELVSTVASEFKHSKK